MTHPSDHSSATDPDMLEPGEEVPQALWLMRTAFIPIWVLLILFGVFGNAVNFRVLMSARLRNSSTTVYLAILSIVDLLYLLTSLNSTLITFLFLFPYDDLRNRHVVLCKLLPFLSYTLSSLSIWILVAVTIDRTIWVLLPFHAKVICTPRRALVVSGLIVLTLVLLHGQFLVYNTHAPEEEAVVNGTGREHNNQSQTPLRYSCNMSSFGRIVLPYMDLCLIAVLPFIIMIVANGLIIHKLQKTRQIRQRHLSKRSDPQEQQRNTSLTRMLLATNIFFMLSTVPLLIYDIVFVAINLHGDRDLLAFWFFAERLVYTVWYLKFSINFILYCLSGARFRDEALHILRQHHFCSLCCNSSTATSTAVVDPTCTQQLQTPTKTDTTNVPCGSGSRVMPLQEKADFEDRQVLTVVADTAL